MGWNRARGDGVGWADQAWKGVGSVVLADTISYSLSWTWSANTSQLRFVPVLSLAQVRVDPQWLLGLILGQVDQCQPILRPPATKSLLWNAIQPALVPWQQCGGIWLGLGCPGSAQGLKFKLESGRWDNPSPQFYFKSSLQYSRGRWGCCLFCCAFKLFPLIDPALHPDQAGPIQFLSLDNPKQPGIVRLNEAWHLYTPSVPPSVCANWIKCP